MEEKDYLEAVNQAGDEEGLVKAYKAYMEFKGMPSPKANLLFISEFSKNSGLPPELQDIAQAVFERLKVLGLEKVVEIRMKEGDKVNKTLEELDRRERFGRE